MLAKLSLSREDVIEWRWKSNLKNLETSEFDTMFIIDSLKKVNDAFSSAQIIYPSIIDIYKKNFSIIYPSGLEQFIHAAIDELANQYWFKLSGQDNQGIGISKNRLIAISVYYSMEIDEFHGISPSKMKSKYNWWSKNVEQEINKIKNHKNKLHKPITIEEVQIFILLPIQAITLPGLPAPSINRAKQFLLSPKS